MPSQKHSLLPPEKACKISLCLLVLCLLSLNLQAQQRPQVGLVLAGGSAKGFAHIGVLKVLEEVNMPIDYVTGTSMGAIVGGLFAIGYSAAEMDSIVSSVNWSKLLIGAPLYPQLSWKQKERIERYAVDLELSLPGVSLPSGLLSGQDITRMLCRLTLPVHHLERFSDFPRPFACIATNLANGEAVVLKSGNFAEALRASMAIPTAFTPVTIGDSLLVDGYLVRNLPAEDVRALGAQLVIGVNIEQEIQPVEKVTSLIEILNQIQNLMLLPGIEAQKELCDVMLEPDFGDITIMDFNRSREIIDLGERHARDHYAALKQLADSLNALAPRPEARFPAMPDSLLISEIAFEGFRNRSPDILGNHLPGLLPALLTPAEIDNLVDRIYAIQVFERVGYRIMPIPGKVSNKLLIKVEEKSENRFQAGLRYDNRHNAFLLLNTRFYNLLTDLSTLDLDLKLGELSRFALQYDLPVGWSSSMATRLGIDFGEDRIDLYQRDRRAQRFTTRSLTSTLFMGSLRAKNVLIGAGVRGQLLRQEVDIGNVDQAEKDIYTAAGFARMGLDYTDSKTFPVRGFRSELNVEASTDRLNSDPAFFRVMGSGDLFLPLHRHWTLLVSGEAGTVRGDSLSLIRPYYLGGVREPRTFQGLPRSFYGLRAQERIAEHLMVGAGGLQWKDNSGWFAQFHYNVAAIFEARLLGERQPLVQGWGALVGYELPVGPLVFAAHGGNGQLHTFLSMGFFF